MAAGGLDIESLGVEEKIREIKGRNKKLDLIRDVKVRIDIFNCFGTSCWW